jgi:gamma-glutamylcyclotransferase (GGCT)/AIG2-like uncharacterized protein YtfP
MTNRLFFYGTLMSDDCRGHVLRGFGRPVARGTVRGDLFEVGSGMFPALMPGDGVVHGEVWEVDPSLLRAALNVTDRIESYREDDEPGSMYVRREVPLLSAEGAAHAGDTVLTYVWNHGPDWLTARIKSGRWRERFSFAAAEPMEAS